MTIKVAHDFVCPWCWIALNQVRKLREEFPVDFEWLAYPIWPSGLERRDREPAAVAPGGRPATPTRLDLMCLVEGVAIPSVVRPNSMPTENAHLAIEFSKRHGTQDGLVESLYNAYWRAGLEINALDVLERLATPFVPRVRDLIDAVVAGEDRDKVIGFDEPAYRTGIYYVPTYIIAEQRLAEQPYAVLREAVEREFQGVLA